MCHTTIPTQIDLADDIFKIKCNQNITISWQYGIFLQYYKYKV